MSEFHHDYDVITLDLSTARTKEKVYEFREERDVELIVLKADAAAYMMLNSKNKQGIYCYSNLKFKFRLKEIYITNSSASGSLIILLLW